MADSGDTVQPNTHQHDSDPSRAVAPRLIPAFFPIHFLLDTSPLHPPSKFSTTYRCGRTGPESVLRARFLRIQWWCASKWGAGDGSRRRRRPWWRSCCCPQPLTEDGEVFLSSPHHFCDCISSISFWAQAPSLPEICSQIPAGNIFLGVKHTC